MTLLALKNWGVPFASPTGRVWPVLGRAKIVSYTLADGKVVGNGATCFHASRQDGTRYHAGVDLPCLPGDKVVAMETGTIIGQISGFVKLGAVVVEHPSCVAVYAEVALDSLARSGLKPGSVVAAGQTIAFGAINYEENSMLHLETWSRGNAPKFYTPWMVGSPPPTGLLDPSQYMLSLSLGAAPSTGGGVPSMSTGSRILGAGLIGYAAYKLFKWVKP